MNKMQTEKSLQERIEEAKLRRKQTDEVMETIAESLGFKPDKYYTAREKMFMSGGVKNSGIPGNNGPS